MIIKCANPKCENEFERVSRQIFCCADCRNEAYKMQEWQEIVVQKRNSKKSNAKKIAELSRKARESGMSYGAYVAMISRTANEIKN